MSSLQEDNNCKPVHSEVRLAGTLDMADSGSADSDSADSDSVARPRPRAEGLRLAPILLVLALWLGTSWLVVGAALHPVLPGGWAAIIVLMALTAIPIWRLALGFRGLAYPSAAVRLFVMLPFGVPASVARTFLLAGSGVLGAAALAGYAGSRRLVRRHLEVHMPRLPVAFDGLRIVQISDLHVGPHTSRSHLARVAAAVRAEAPDLIAITGDQVDDFARDVDPFVQAFGALTAPLGVYAVPGNHDVYAGWSGVARGLREAGLQVLVNEHVPITRGDARLWIAGTGDPAGLGWPGAEAARAAPDVARTLAGIPRDEPVVVLAHNPALWPALAARGVDLTLSGHTHYGQLAIPGRRWSLASPFLKHAMGAYRDRAALLYINPGTNYWGIPFRLGTPPEVTVLTLRAGSSEPGIDDA
jgi:predicted MPP superfamily phosphohydrolase